MRLKLFVVPHLCMFMPVVFNQEVSSFPFAFRLLYAAFYTLRLDSNVGI